MLKGDSSFGRCNRIPFKPDEECPDRGDVATSMFEELPYCGEYDPTRPGVPPEILGTNINVPLPAYNCACVNLDYGFSFGYAASGNSFGAKASFRVDGSGDCCEGNYVTNFDLKIPCPVRETSGRGGTLRVGVGYGSGPASASAKVVRADSSSCTVEPVDADIDLKIPCPVSAKKPMAGKMRVGIGVFGGVFTGTASFIAANSASCTVEPLFADLRIDIPDGDVPCPVGGMESSGGKMKKDGKAYIEASVNYGERDADQERALFMTKDSDDCNFNARDASLHLHIPCPVVAETGSAVLTIKGRAAGISFSDSVEFMKMDADNCTIQPLDATLNLNIPCPVKKKKEGPNLEFGHQVEDARKELRKSFILRLRREGAKAAFASASADLVEVDSSDCTVGNAEASMDLSIPCPVRAYQMDTGDESYVGPLKIRASIEYGSNESWSGGAANDIERTYGSMEESCRLSMASEVRLNLRIPCPITSEMLEFAGAVHGIDSASFLFGEGSYGSVEGGCVRRVKAELTVPKLVRDVTWFGGAQDSDPGLVVHYTDGSTRKISFVAYNY